MRRRPSLVALLTLALVVAGGGAALAVWADAASVGSNSFSTTDIRNPTLLTAITECHQQTGKPRVVLNWNAPTSGASPDGYDVYRSSPLNTSYSLKAHVSGGSTTTYTDAGLNQSTVFWYKVRSTRGGWTSGFSNEVSAETPICV